MEAATPSGPRHRKMPGSQGESTMFRNRDHGSGHTRKEFAGPSTRGLCWFMAGAIVHRSINLEHARLPRVSQNGNRLRVVMHLHTIPRLQYSLFPERITERSAALCTSIRFLKCAPHEEARETHEKEIDAPPPELHWHTTPPFWRWRESVSQS